MKYLIYLCVILTLFLFVACQKNGQIVSTPTGIESAVTEHCLKLNYEVKGMTVREYPNEVFLVSAQTQYIGQSNIARNSNLNFIAQKGRKPDGTAFWNVQEASKSNLELFGIK